MNRHPLELRAVSLQLHSRVLVAPLTLTIAPGEVVTVMGESGSGKSSLLAYLCGTLPSAFRGTGELIMNEQNLLLLPPERRRLGILFQDDLLFPHLSVAQNLAFALPPHVCNRSERRDRIENALVEAGLAGFGPRDPFTLSGGQRARVALMRVLLSEPRALLLDEPFSKLDRQTRQRFREFVLDHIGKSCLPTLLVTHDSEDASAAGGRIVQLTPELETPT